ncbi:MAG: hypothetical protein NC084_13205, partial [Bacteroides sp.]|nr:hypothetical protein [Bacteroides sp.]
MGIKENFSQAIRELTGGEKEDRRSDKATVDGMRSAVDADDTGEFNAITEPPAETERDEFEEIERRAAEAAEAYNRRQGELDGLRPTETPSAFDGGAGFNAPPSFDRPSAPSFGAAQGANQNTAQGAEQNPFAGVFGASAEAGNANAGEPSRG